MPDTLRIRLVTPDRILVDEDAQAVDIPAKNGYLEVLYGHAPLLAEVGAGEVRLHGGQAGDQRYTVARGFVEVLPDRVTILAEWAEKPEEIDAQAAEEQLQRGEQMWAEAGDEARKYDEANAVIAEATAKLHSAGGKS